MSNAANDDVGPYHANANAWRRVEGSPSFDEPPPPLADRRVTKNDTCPHRQSLCRLPPAVRADRSASPRTKPANVPSSTSMQINAKSPTRQIESVIVRTSESGR
ncbi:MAG: hypothetical protein IIB66_05460 [Proteobacteria bacterium]|nr:hypothetical protein [Pseudomonadota bacterium]